MAFSCELPHSLTDLEVYAVRRALVLEVGFLASSSKSAERILGLILGLAKNHPWMLATLGCPGTSRPRKSSVDKFLS